MLSRWAQNRIASVKSGNEPPPSRSALKKNWTVSLFSFRLCGGGRADRGANARTRQNGGTWSESTGGLVKMMQFSPDGFQEGDVVCEDLLVVRIELLERDQVVDIVVAEQVEERSI